MTLNNVTPNRDDPNATNLDYPQRVEVLGW